MNQLLGQGRNDRHLRKGWRMLRIRATHLGRNECPGASIYQIIGVKMRGASKLLSILLLMMISVPAFLGAQIEQPRFKVIALAERGGIHEPYVEAAKIWLAEEAIKDNFTIEYIENTDRINDDFLSHYRLFIQLNYPPYMWTPVARKAFKKYIETGEVDGSGFITPRSLENSTAIQCGSGFQSLWEASAIRTTLPHSHPHKS